MAVLVVMVMTVVVAVLVVVVMVVTVVVRMVAVHVVRRDVHVRAHHAVFEGLDLRNYGGLDGIPACKALFAELLDVKPENILIGGNASLTMMYDNIMRLWVFGDCDGNTPWSKLDTVSYTHLNGQAEAHLALHKIFGDGYALCKRVFKGFVAV